MTEYNTHTEEDPQHHPHPGDQHVAGSHWGERPEDHDLGTDGEPAEGRTEPADDEPMVEHVDERPLGEEHDGVTEPRWSDSPATPEGAAASPFAGEGVRDDEEPIVLGAADDDLHDHERTDDGAHSDVTEPASAEEPITAPAAGGLDDRTDDDLGENASAEEPVVVPVDGDHERTDDGVTAAADTGARPTSADDFDVERLIGTAEAERFSAEWREVKATFVDDPSDALQKASALSTQVLDELTASLGRLRQNLDDHWHEDESSDTERLRIALRGYGSLIDRILST